MSDVIDTKGDLKRERYHREHVRPNLIEVGDASRHQGSKHPLNANEFPEEPDKTKYMKGG